MSSTEPDERTEKALRHCRSLINYYEKVRKSSRRNYMIFQSSSIILSGITPVLILGTEIPKIYQALPAALASIAAGLVIAFHYQENWIAYKISSETLKSELLAFETRTSEWYRSDVGEEQALNNFLSRVEGIHKGEITAWSARLNQRSMSPKDDKQ